jgi:hypothetical protein
MISQKTIQHFKLPQMMFNFLQNWANLPLGAGANPTKYEINLRCSSFFAIAK